MSGASVCVLALNGRRQTVKCTPNTTILQILEEVCQKQRLKSDEFDLKHHNKVLDTSQTFRFSGLPNNAQLELVPATRAREESEVTLAATLETGQRVTGNFNPNETLTTILSKLCPEVLQHELSPVIIYTRREIYGDELDTVTLKSLGLTGGRAMIRILHRAPEDLKTQANVSKVIPSKPAAEQPYIRKYQPTEEPVAEAPKVMEDNEIKPQPVPKKDNDILKMAREKRKSIDSQEKQVKISPQPKKKNACSCEKHQAMDIDDVSCPDTCKGTCCDKDTRINLDENFVFLGDRNAMLFSQETAEAIPHEDLPDEFFDLTIDDARKLLRDVRKQQHLFENTPLMTSNLRNLEDSKKQLRQINRYKKAIIRIQFPDRIVLQGTFNPSDTIKDVMDFTRQYLHDESTQFYVFTTPPKCILNESSLLIEEGFVPGAVIHFGTDDFDQKNYLRTDLHNKITSNSIASLAAAQIRKQNTRKCGVEQEDIDYSEVKRVNEGASTSTSATPEEEPPCKQHQRKPIENAPKWFKPL
ncbi:unnamed protein product [Phyllotreta striolata]|uniref:UBX domain-containing protein n=1 Tax=Phyllotreta striolata TaxID=444603 RepID=A0A9N9XRC1_PHYSR|nr:unnamed protein product [Phyllotreta striolata]